MNIKKYIGLLLILLGVGVLIGILLAKFEEAGASEEVTFPSCKDQIQDGDWAHYDEGWHQIVGNGLLWGQDDVYSLSEGKYLQCYCGLEGNGIQTNWTRSDTGTWGSQWNLGDYFYTYENIEYRCKEEPTPTPTVFEERHQEPAAGAPPEWADKCFYLKELPDCKTKAEVFLGEDDQAGVHK